MLDSGSTVNMLNQKCKWNLKYTKIFKVKLFHTVRTICIPEVLIPSNVDAYQIFRTHAHARSLKQQCFTSALFTIGCENSDLTLTKISLPLHTGWHVSKLTPSCTFSKIVLLRLFGFSWLVFIIWGKNIELWGLLWSLEVLSKAFCYFTLFCSLF